MLSSSRNEEKFEARFLTRLDVLTERVDTLASTVATTASALPKKDGEIAALQRALEAHDQTLRALVEHVNRAAEAPAADVPVDATELRSIRNAVAALTKERAGGVNAARIEGLVTAVRTLGQQLDALSAAAAAPSVPPTDPAVIHRIDTLSTELANARAGLAHKLSESDRAHLELVEGLSALRDEVGALGDLHARVGETGDALLRLSQRLEAIPRVDEEQLERHFAETEVTLGKFEHRLDLLTETLGRIERAHAVDEERLDRRFEDTGHALTTFAQRLDTLAESVESAAAGLGDKERELAAQHRQFTESSTRIESIVDDIREALHAFPEVSSTSMDELAARLERVETAARKGMEASVRTAGELSRRIDESDQRVATVAEEVSRAKTLWPVALRSLEARLDDAVHGRRPEPSAEDATAPTHPTDEPSDDLLAGLRDSLQAMETVVADMARASSTLDETDEAAQAAGSPSEEHRPSAADASEPPEQTSQAAAAAGGATIVPLRAGEP